MWGTAVRVAVPVEINQRCKVQRHSNAYRARIHDNYGIQAHQQHDGDNRVQQVLQ